ncbi:hypothetical protein SLEP1_g16852 [Rubroshorea leprosula]|uniref:Cytochrome P450 n=1 Tax=Rubroshorea leprosula TaxID=152421 RepID=A0AAV5IY32_9ROSI|nr:hypothetical protein SLEP1_g16852 [Rubroshorea leprosula]
MEFLHPFSTTLATGILALLLFLWGFFGISRRRNAQNKKMPPQAGGSWPIIGHLHLLAGPKPPHKIFGEMADKYGPVFTIKLGVHRALIVSSSEMAKECLTTNDKAFATRPKSIAMDILGYNYAMFAFSPYGPYWRHARKVATLELLSNHRLEMFKPVREAEMRTWIKEIHQTWENNKDSSHKALLEMKRWFGDLTLNIIFKVVLGKRYVDHSQKDEEKDQWKASVREFIDFVGKFLISDSLPFLRWLDIGGQEKAMKKTARELELVVKGWLEEHKKKSAIGKTNEEEDFMDVMLSTLNKAELPTTDTDADTVNKATCLVLILAGSDTTTVTLTWALSLLLNNPEALKKAQHELDTIIGRERQVTESDMKNLTYLHAIIKETLRLYPAGPLLVPHESMEDCTVGGYHIPKGTRLFVNASKIQRNSRVWPDPHEFRPERFLTSHKDVDVRGQSFELIPFGSGRRMCPGISFALHVLQLTLATFLHGFEVAVVGNEEVDMTEGSGIANLKATPLEILLSPRLPRQLYG